MQEDSNVVIDNGAGICKAGMSGEDGPRVQFPAVVGRPKFQNIMVGIEQRKRYAGGHAQAQKGALQLSYPNQHGLIKNWEDMTLIWNQALDIELRVRPSDHGLILTEPTFNPKVNRQKTIQIMIQEFKVAGFYLAKQALLSLYSSGRTTGLVLDAGERAMYSVPVYEGYMVGHAIQRNKFAGYELTEYMNKMLINLGYDFHSSAEHELVRQIKEKLCYVALEYETELKNTFHSGDAYNRTYELPDGENLTIGPERFQCPQAIFKPALIGKELPGLHQMCYQSIANCNIHIRKDLYCSLVISGGTTMFPGFPERFHKEMVGLIPSTMKVKVIAPAERRPLVWIGGSILGSLSSFNKDMKITKAQYQEHGPTIIHKKCP